MLEIIFFFFELLKKINYNKVKTKVVMTKLLIIIFNGFLKK